MTEEEKKIITQEKHSGRVAQGHRLAALMKKRKEILRNKEQSTEQSSVQSTEQSSVQSSVQSTVQSNDTYIYGVGMLAVLAIGVYVFFAYNTFSKNKKQANEKKYQPQRLHVFKKKLYNK